MKKNNVLILNGSPKINNSSSKSLAEFMENELNKKGVDPKIRRVSTCIASEQGVVELMECIREADLLFLISPLYVDSLPYNVIKMLELIKIYIGPDTGNRSKKFFALSHSGLDVTKNDVSVRIYERFAKELNFNFGGSLALGTSSIINGNSLNFMNRMTKNLRKSLEIISESIFTGNSIPPKVQKLLSKPFLPAPLFLNKILLNATMKSCYREKDFTKGLAKLHSKLKIFLS